MGKSGRGVALFFVVWLIACGGGKHRRDTDEDAGQSDASGQDSSVDKDTRDPVDRAPRLDPSVATLFSDAVEFLFTGDSPIQTGVEPGAIDKARIAVVRGRVVGTDGQPVADARVTVFSHGQYGQTLTRADGWYDLAVNGGGTLTLRVEREGYLTVDRPGQPRQLDYLVMPEVVLTKLDEKATNVEFSGASTVQVARGTMVKDKDGARQPALLAPAGVEAEMVLSDGTTKPLASGAIRITEYTVGDSGPAAMPAPLPSNTGYTYAVELSADEALKEGADTVKFSKPLVYYVENFLGFPDGSAVPSGYYDRKQARWIAEPDGRVIRLLSVDDGRASVDADGDGAADKEQALTELGIDAEELARLALLYKAGQSLWRFPIKHFSPCDFNWWLSRTSEAKLPSLDLLDADPRTDCASEVSGSIIECENRTLGERVAVSGTPFSLNYRRSDRVPGRTSARSFTIPITGDEVTPELLGIELEVQIGGQVFRQKYEPKPDLTHRFTWDGLNAYRRKMQGAVPAHVILTYLYDVTYVIPPNVNPSFGIQSQQDSGIKAREELRRVTTADITLRPWESVGLGLGGWTLDIHHQYDPNGKVLYLGDGRRRGTEGADQMVADPVYDFTKGLEENEPYVHSLVDIAFAPSGELYVLRTLAELEPYRIRGFIYRIGTDRKIEKLAGCRSCMETRDGLLAVDTLIEDPKAMALGPDGSVYFTDSFRLRRVRPDGIIETIACNGDSLSKVDGFNENGVADGLIATSGPCAPHGVAVDSDGRVLFVDWAKYDTSMKSRIRAVGREGRISTVAELRFPDGYESERVRMGPEGSMYTVSRNGVFRATQNNTVERLSGDCCAQYTGDGSAAIDTDFDASDVAVISDGSILVASGCRWDDYHVYRIGPDGRTYTYAGNGDLGFKGIGYALDTPISVPTALAVDARGTVWIAAQGADVIFKIRDQLPGVGDDKLMIASENGRQLYEITSNGKHVQTLDAYSGKTIYSFKYATSGELSEVEDAYGNITRVERGAKGDPQALLGPFGQRTELTVNSQGYLSSITNPAGGRIALENGDGGLLTSLIDEKGGTHRFTYSEDGLLERDEAPEPDKNGYETLSESGFGRDRAVTLTSAEGRSNQYHTKDDRWMVTRTVTDPAGFETKSRKYGAGTSTVTQPDKVSADVVLQRDNSSGIVTGVTLGNIATARTHNGFAEPLVSETKRGNTLLFSEQITGRDRSGRIITKREVIQGESHEYAYTYDTAGRLASASKDGAILAEYQYDGNGNRLSLTTPSGVEEGSYDDQDRQLRYGAREYTYSNAGQLTSATDVSNGSTTSYRYDVLGNLRTVALSDSREIVYEIDGFNRRVGKRVNGAVVYRLLYQDDLKPVAILDASNAVIATFVYATQPHVPDYMERGGVTCRLITDHLGSVRLVVNTADGTIAQRIDYDEYGRVLSDTNPGFQPFGFAGGLCDADTGLVRFGARDYDAYTGRWTAKDPVLFVGGDTNLYGYVVGDPINFIDPNGNLGFLLTAGIGGAIGAAGGALGALATGQNIGTAAFIGGVTGAFVGSGGWLFTATAASMGASTASAALGGSMGSFLSGFTANLAKQATRNPGSSNCGAGEAFLTGAMAIPGAAASPYVSAYAAPLGTASEAAGKVAVGWLGSTIVFGVKAMSH